jgi:peptidoglycan-associated lipoprotein
MKSRWIRSSTLLVVLCAHPFLMASSCGDKDKDKGSGEVIEVLPPEVSLQLISMEPASVVPDQPFRAILYGAALESGARVWVGGSEIASVTWRDSNSLGLSVPPMSAGTYDVKVQNPDGSTATLREGLNVRPMLDTTRSLEAGLDCNNIVVRFEFDSFVLTSNSQSELGRNLPCFQSRTGTVRVEGHCDERGTTSYNLSLGQKRATAVQKYLEAQGVVPSRIQTVSYGEERPMDPGGNEAAWAINRRAVISVGR